MAASLTNKLATPRAKPFEAGHMIWQQPREGPPELSITVWRTVLFPCALYTAGTQPSVSVFSVHVMSTLKCRVEASHCICLPPTLLLHQIQLILIACYVRYHRALRDNCRAGQLWTLIPRASSSTIW